MQSFGKWAGFSGDRTHGCRVGAVDAQIRLVDLLASPTMNLQVLRSARTLVQPSHRLRLINRVLGHLAIRRPFASGDRQQPGVGNQYSVVPGQCRGASGVTHLHQWPQTRIDAQHVAARRTLRQVLGGIRKDEFDFLIGGDGLQRDLLHGEIRCSHHHVVVPRHCKKHTSIGRVRHHDGAFARQERFRQYQMRALACGYHCPRCGFVHPADPVAERAGRVDDDTGVNFALGPALHIADHRPRNQLSVFDQGHDLHVVDRDAAQIEYGLGQIHGEPRVIELAVIIADAPLQTLGFQRGNSPQRLFFRKHLRRTKSQLSGKTIIDLHADAVEGTFPPAIDRHDERKVVHQMRRVFAQQAAFSQRFKYKRDIALLQVAHAAMNQLDAAAGRALGEVRLLHHERAVAARRRINAYAQPGCPSADDEKVPRLLR
jgi:hypothetical protein